MLRAAESNERILESGLTGYVKWFDPKKGIGFIVSDDGREIYVHISGLATKGWSLEANQAVKFDVAEGRKGPKCVNVEGQ